MENTRKKILENKIELVDEIIEEIIELPAESEGMNELPSYTEKNYRELSAVEKEDLINSLMKDDYLKYKNCYISRSKLLYDSSETLIKEISALSQLNELGYEIYLLPYSYARDSMNFYKKSADSITYGDFLELKSTISTNERAGQNCYEAGRKQADNIYISFVNDISEEKALKSIYGSIGNIKKGNRKHNIEDNFKGLLFLNFEKKGEIHLYDISKEGYVTKIENPSFENLKKILEDNKISQVIVNPSNERRSPRDLNLHQDIESVNSKEYQNFQDKKMENYVITQERNGEITVLASSYKNAIFVGGDYLSDYETYNLEKVNNLLKDLQESNPDNEYRIMTENDFRKTYLLDENKLTPTEYLAQKINASGINIHLSKEEMKAILDAGKNVQKMALQNVNFVEMTFYDFERNFEPKYKDYEIDCAGMGILSVQNKIEEIERRNNNTVLTVNASDGSAYHTYFDLNSWKEFKESVNSRGASITKVWVTEEFDRKKNEQAFYEKREEYWENKYKNENVQYMKSENGEVYGFTFDGEIYIDEDLVNSNVLAHEYTHIWDNYVQKNNPELWNKGMTCLKGTSLWYEIKEDKNYENLRTDDEILSECHARIVGKMAEQVLERIAARDGELTKDKIIDWDREVSEYVATELLIKPELGDENYISESVKAEYLKEFLSMPMKDLMNEVRIHNFNQSNDIQEMRKNIEALKTPFGQNSKLNYKEWSFARSDEFKKQFGDWESIQKKNFLLSNETVISLKGDEFPKKEGISLTEQVENFFKKNTDNIISPFFGKVSLDKRGLKNSVYHGINRIKAIAYAAVPEVINKGVIIDKSINHKNRGYDSYVVAAPIKIKEENYICEVVLKKNKNGTEFYLHEVTEQKKYLDRAFVTRRGKSPAQNPGTIVNLLDNIISVNSPVLCPMNENGEPEKSFVKNELKKIQKYAEIIDKVNELSLNKKSSKPDMQIDKTSISSESPSFPVEPQLSLGSRADHISVEGGRSSIDHLEKQDSAVSISARTDTSNIHQNNDEVNVKIQKYAETIDNSQTENPEESVEKSPKDIKPEISVVCGEIKSILGNKFTGGNIKLSQDFQHELIEKGLVNPEEEFVLINDAEAVAQGCKIKSDQPFVFLNIPVENNGKTDFVQTKYYHVSALEESQKIEKNIIYGETKVPEFAIITQHGLKTYSNLIIESYDPTSHSYLLQSEDGSQRLNITEETYNELMSNTFQEKAQSFTDDDPAYNKLLETQYNDYFKQRDNTAYNFKHNLSVYCRKEANSPCNALEIAKGIISRMSVEEKNKTKSLLKKMANGKTLNEVIVDIYHEAIKEVPLNEEYIKIKVPEKVIARPFYDTISTKGNLVSKEHNLKIGDTLKNVNIKSDKLFGKGSENITFDELKIISSSKEGNCITLMDANKSFVEVPLDTVLASYEKYKVNTQKQEKRNKVSMDISY